MMMMPEARSECEWVLAELAEREPASEVARRLEAHLAVCPSCRKAREWDRRLAALIFKSAPSVPRTIARRVHAMMHRRRAIRWMCVAVAGAAAACLLLVLGGYHFAHLQEPDPTGASSLASLDSSATERDDLAELTLLVSDPPVTTVCRTQPAWLVVLSDVCEGDRP
jgi:predicted anti-sigma-YlaC factor YlaD